jgi:hypothetical protein
LEVLNLNDAVLKNLPGRKRREKTFFRSFSNDEQGRLIHFAKKIMEEICKVICPFDAQGLLEAITATSKPTDVKLLENIKAAVNALPSNTVQSDVLLATVANSYDAEFMNKEFNIGKIKLASLRRKFTHISSGLLLQAHIRSVQRFRRPDVQQAVRFILSDSNVQRISWGTKKVVVDGGEIELPKLIRKQAIR